MRRHHASALAVGYSIQFTSDVMVYLFVLREWKKEWLRLSRDQKRRDQRGWEALDARGRECKWDSQRNCRNCSHMWDLSSHGSQLFLIGLSFFRGQADFWEENVKIDSTILRFLTTNIRILRLVSSTFCTKWLFPGVRNVYRQKNWHAVFCGVIYSDCHRYDINWNMKKYTNVKTNTSLATVLEYEYSLPS